MTAADKCTLCGQTRADSFENHMGMMCETSPNLMHVWPKGELQPAEPRNATAISSLIDFGVAEGLRADRYERALKAISTCTLTGASFGDYVQTTCEDVLAGLEAECPICGTCVHEGPCVGEGEDA